MTYEEFKAIWEQELRDAGLRPTIVQADETLHLVPMDRSYEIFVEPETGQQAEPFFVTVKFGFVWSALNSARTRTTEEEILSEMVGLQRDKNETIRPWIKLDVVLSATLAWGKSLPMPSTIVLAKWAREIKTRIAAIEPVIPEEALRDREGADLAYLAWYEAPTVKASCGIDGELKVEGVELPAWLAINIPRTWDDTRHAADEPPHEQLRHMLARLKAALIIWTEAMAQLVPRSPTEERRPPGEGRPPPRSRRH